MKRLLFIFCCFFLAACSSENVVRMSPVGIHQTDKVIVILPSGSACGWKVAPKNCWPVKAREELEKVQRDPTIKIIQVVPIYYSDTLRGFEVYFEKVE